MIKPGAEVKRFKLDNVRVRRVEGVADAVQTFSDLEIVARSLHSSGLVQVDEKYRMFGMHQLLQHAVGNELGWQQSCERMKALLHARCGKFGDEHFFDVRLFGVMREVVGTAVASVHLLRKKGRWLREAWCCGMLLRLCEVAREVHGHGTDVYTRFAVAAHRSLLAALVQSHVVSKGCSFVGRRTTLQQVVEEARNQPLIRDVISMDLLFKPDDNDQKLCREEVKKGRTLRAASDTVVVSKFDLQSCLNSHFGLGSLAFVVASLVHRLVMEEGHASNDGRTLPIQVIIAMPLIKDLMALRDGAKCDLRLLLDGACGLRVIDDGGADSSVWAHCRTADIWNDADEYGMGRWLRAMRWRWHTLFGVLVSREKIINEIKSAHDAEDANHKWEVGVALGAAFHTAGLDYNEPETREKEFTVFKHALDIRRATLGEHHPYSGITLYSMGSAAFFARKFRHCIEFQEKALRILQSILGQHPETARSLNSLGAALACEGEYKKSIGIMEQALQIYGHTVGRMHRDTAETTGNIGFAYFDLKEFEKAEQYFKEAIYIFDKTLGSEHELTVKYRLEFNKKFPKHAAAQRGNGGTVTVTPSRVVSALHVMLGNHTFCVGDRVQRGPDWKWGSQDDGMAGTVIEMLDSDGCVKVQWDGQPSRG